MQTCVLYSVYGVAKVRGWGGHPSLRKRNLLLIALPTSVITACHVVATEDGNNSGNIYIQQSLCLHILLT